MNEYCECRRVEGLSRSVSWKCILKSSYRSADFEFTYSKVSRVGPLIPQRLEPSGRCRSSLNIAFSHHFNPRVQRTSLPPRSQRNKFQHAHPHALSSFPGISRRRSSSAARQVEVERILADKTDRSETLPVVCRLSMSRCS